MVISLIVILSPQWRRGKGSRESESAQVIFKDVQMVQTLQKKERTGRENRQTTIRVHNNITFRVWHVISFLSPLWKTKLQLRLHITTWLSSSSFCNFISHNSARNVRSRETLKTAIFAVIDTPYKQIHQQAHHQVWESTAF